MKSIWDATYIVTDVETTGSNSSKDRITEIACVTVKNGEITSQFSTLINPHKEIPSYIAKMTGISQSMVSSAPEEYQIFESVNSVFKVDTPVFVAHNVAFDYGFISSFYKRAYRTFDYPMLCSLKLARKLLPNDVKKNVGDMSRYFGIKLGKRHRALIDARATAMSLIEMLHLAETEHRITMLSELMTFQSKPVYNYKVSNDVLKRLNINFSDIPYQPGLFKFYDHNGDLLYFDATFNLNDKLRSFFNSHHITSRFILDLTTKIDKIDYETTDNELSSLILKHKVSKNNKIEEGTLNLFQNTENNKPSISNFIYIQPYDSKQRIVDIYIIYDGRLVNFQTIGIKQPLDPIVKIIQEKFSFNNYQSHSDQGELKVINKWKEMQNGFGVEFVPSSTDRAILTNELREQIHNAYSLVYEIENFQEPY